MDITEQLQAAIKTTQERHKVYGDGYVRSAHILLALFPNGLKLNTEDEWVQFYFLYMIVTKLTRYSFSLESGAPHQDSIHDLGIYSLMLERIDKEQMERNAALTAEGKYIANEDDFVRDDVKPVFGR